MADVYIGIQQREETGRLMEGAAEVKENIWGNKW